MRHARREGVKKWRKCFLPGVMEKFFDRRRGRLNLGDDVEKNTFVRGAPKTWGAPGRVWGLGDAAVLFGDHGGTPGHARGGRAF